jgi:hypothetical protein
MSGNRDEPFIIREHVAHPAVESWISISFENTSLDPSTSLLVALGDGHTSELEASTCNLACQCILNILEESDRVRT